VAKEKPQMTDKIELSEAEWREKLTPEQYAVLRQAGTERAFTGKYDKNKQTGMYTCAGCGAPLFSSETKYNSGSGWPSYTAPIEGEAVDKHRDTAHGMVRTQVRGPSGPCIPGRPGTDRLALLHQLGSPGFRAQAGRSERLIDERLGRAVKGGLQMMAPRCRRHSLLMVRHGGS
jgi:peptide-methionine (R)-S-oxide reductase